MGGDRKLGVKMAQAQIGNQWTAGYAAIKGRRDDSLGVRSLVWIGE